MINITRGWPEGHASAEEYPYNSSQNIPAGSVVVVENNSGEPQVRLATSADVQAVLDHVGGVAIDSNLEGGTSSRYAGKLPVVHSNFTAQTTQFDVGGSYVPGLRLEISSSNAGRLAPFTSGAVFGVVVSYDANAKILTYRRG